MAYDPAPQHSVVSLATLVTRVQQHLMDNPQADTCTLADASTTTLTAGDFTKYGAGDLVQISEWSATNNELVRVVATPSSASVTVNRGVYGSTAATAAAGTVCFIAPNYPKVQIERTIAETVDELWPWAWQLKAVTVTPVSGTVYYTAPDDFVSFVDRGIVQKTTTSATSFVQYNEYNTGRPVKIVDVPESQDAHNRQFYIPAINNLTNDIYVQYAAYHAVSGTTTTVTDGVMAACVTYGAVAKLLGGQSGQLSTQILDQNPPDPLRPASWFASEHERLKQLIRLQQRRERELVSEWRL